MTASPVHPPPATSLLRHSPRGEPAHFDWLVVLDGSTPDAEARVVPCYRLASRLDLAESGAALEALALPPHRGLYLTLGEPRTLSGDRGRIEPVRHGVVRAVRPVGDALLIDLTWNAVGAGTHGPEEHSGAVAMRLRVESPSDESGGPIGIRVEGVETISQDAEARAWAGPEKFAPEARGVRR